MRAKPLTFERARRLRRELTLPEIILWDCLRKGRLEALRFRRQHPIGPYVLDFYCARAHLAVEIDGAGHGHPDQARHDRRRDQWLADRGIRVMRLAASGILGDDTLSSVLQEIETAANH
ncbi:MAG TPA: endonuclease domain-containing protein [Caulobacteraceae bacterium]|jgi:very-short-patch-repair endonuclease